MARLKMKYGIDLGTTNSSICKIEHGEPVIKKTDTLKDTLPSCVSFTRRRQIRVGDSAFNDLKQDKCRSLKTKQAESGNVFVEFKRTMGLDTMYESSNMGRCYTSEELSAEVLKTLKSFVIDENVDAAVITVPAKFKAPEIAATMRAAKLAGIEKCVLLQEPIAASMAYGLKTDNKNGYWLVFDFGGGTFDAALLNVEDGIMKVKDTDGDNYLGGKNLDYAIVDNIIIPYLKENYSINGMLEDDRKRTILRDALKYYAEIAKNQFSIKTTVDIMSLPDEFGEDDEGEPIELDMLINVEQVNKVLSPIFQKAIDIVKKLLQRNNLKGEELSSLILVGGPTYSPLLRKMLKNQITPNVDGSNDLMTAVARGAALYAATQEYEMDLDKLSQDQTVAIDLLYEATSVQNQEYVIIKLLDDESKGIDGKKLAVEVVSKDGSWSSGKLALTSKGDAVECPLNENQTNFFEIMVYDEFGNKYTCFPNEITIIQGSQVGSATLPYNIGIEAYDNLRDRKVFVALKGLEKNQLLPAVGVRKGLKIQHELNPGNAKDVVRIPIYQGEYNNEGSSAIYNDHVFDVVITGKDVPDYVPNNSEIDIVLNVNKSQGYHIEVHFEALNYTYETDVDVATKTVITYKDWLNEFSEANKKLDRMKSVESINAKEFVEVEKMVNDLDCRKDAEYTKDDDREHLLADLRRVFLKLEEIEKYHEWETAEAELRKSYDELIRVNDKSPGGYEEFMRDMNIMVNKAIDSCDVKMVLEVKAECDALTYEINLPNVLRNSVIYYYKNFDIMHWHNKTRARIHINNAIELIENDAELEDIRDEVINIQKLLILDNTSDSELPIIY